MSGFSRYDGRPTYEVTDKMTEWDEQMMRYDIQTRDEILEARGLNPEDWPKNKPKEVIPEDPTADEIVDTVKLEELDELEDDEEFDDTRMIEEFRKKRLAEMREARLKARFGDVREIVKVDYVRECTEASKDCWVVIHLYEDHVVGCELLNEAMAAIAPKFPHVKFLKIKSQQASENWPEDRLPSMFLYNEGEVKYQMFTLKELGGNTCKPDNLEWYLAMKEIVTTELEGNPLHTYVQTQINKAYKLNARARAGLDSDDEIDDDLDL